MSTESLKDILLRFLPNPKSRIKKLKDVRRQHQENLAALRAGNLLKVGYSASSVNALEWSSQEHHNAVNKIRKGNVGGSPRSSLSQIVSPDTNYYHIENSELEQQVEDSLQTVIHQINCELAVAYFLLALLFLAIIGFLIVIQMIVNSTLDQVIDIIIRSMLQMTPLSL